MSEKFTGKKESLAFAENGVLVVPKDDVNISTHPKASPLFVASAGTVKFRCQGGGIIETAELPAGYEINYIVDHVFSTGTTATLYTGI